MSTAEGDLQSPARTVYRLSGLTCADCAARFEQKLKEYPGVLDARVNFGASKVTIWGKAPTAAVVNELGAFDRIRVDEIARKGPVARLEQVGRPWWSDRAALLTALSGVTVVFAYTLQLLDARNAVAVSPTSIILLYLLAVVTGGWSTGKLGLQNLLRLKFDMNTLMTVAVGGALAIGFWEEAAVVAFYSA